MLAILAAAALLAIDIDVMTFNIRYGTASDGENAWPQRRSQVMDMLREEAPQVLGLQEALAFQIDEILAAFPHYAAVGLGRDDGLRGGEHSSILFDSRRFTVGASGTFWLSDTPTVPGSTSWGNRITRICTWARLIDRQGRGLWIYNCHLDHESQPSREKSVALILERLSSGEPKEPAILMGDFNAGEDNAAVAQVRAAGLIDSYRKLHPEDRDVATFTGFRFGAITGPKIDHIFCTSAFGVLRAAIVRTSREGRYPSDHFPVSARLRLL